MAGATFRKIAEQIIRDFGKDRLPKNYDERYAWSDVTAELDRLTDERTEMAEEIRRLELERLDRMFLGLWQSAIQGDTRAINSALRVMERRSKLLGIEAPAKVALTDTEGRDVSLLTIEEIQMRVLALVDSRQDVGEVIDVEARLIEAESD